MYIHRKNWITVSILQYRVIFWTPEIVPRLSKLSKSVDSFCIRCGLGWVLGGYAGTINSWAFPEKTTKIHQLSSRPLLYFLFMEDVWNFYDTFLTTYTYFFFLIFKMVIRFWDIRVQIYPTSAHTIKTTNCRPGHLYTLCLWQMVEIFMVHSSDSVFIYFAKSWFVTEIQVFKVTPLLHVQSKVPIAVLVTSILYVYDRWMKFFW